jgi:hypothetical protein
MLSNFVNDIFMARRGSSQLIRLILSISVTVVSCEIRISDVIILVELPEWLMGMTRTFPKGFKKISYGFGRVGSNPALDVLFALLF